MIEQITAKESLFGSIVAFGFHMMMLGKFKILLEKDETWNEAVNQSEIKAKEMIKNMEETIKKDFYVKKINESEK